MPKRKFSDHELDAILSSLDGIKKATPEAFLFTRIMARIQRSDDNAWARVLKFVSKPAFALVIAIIFLFINGYILVGQFRNTVEPAEESTQSMAMEYTSLSTPYYDVNEEIP
jgi:hypothetical protein